jgi:hypothetical protein
VKAANDQEDLATTGDSSVVAGASEDIGPAATESEAPSKEDRSHLSPRCGSAVARRILVPLHA